MNIVWVTVFEMFLQTDGRWGHNITSQTQGGNQAGPQCQKWEIK